MQPSSLDTAVGKEPGSINEATIVRNLQGCLASISYWDINLMPDNYIASIFPWGGSYFRVLERILTRIFSASKLLSRGAYDSD
jgi:hypothetical protein